MTRTRRALLVLVLALFVIFQFGGLYGYVVGFQGSAVLYNRWAGYFIGMGGVAMILMFVGGAMLIATPVLDWIQKGRDEARTRSEASDPSVREYGPAPSSFIHTTVRESPEDQVQGVLSRKAERIRREVAHLTPSG